MIEMTAAEARRFGIPHAERGRYYRIEDANDLVPSSEPAGGRR